MKTITICGKDYEIDSNALTLIKYRSIFKRDIFEDIKVLNAFLTKQVFITNQLKEENVDIDETTIIVNLSRLLLDDMGLFVEASTRLAYIFIYTANKSIEDYEKWLESIPSVTTNDEWIVEVTEFAVDCFC